jgi:hypothetical protein
MTATVGKAKKRAAAKAKSADAKEKAQTVEKQQKNTLRSV